MTLVAFGNTRDVLADDAEANANQNNKFYMNTN